MIFSIILRFFFFPKLNDDNQNELNIMFFSFDDLSKIDCRSFKALRQKTDISTLTKLFLNFKIQRLE